MDEFALCWNNFQDNIASGFQNLFDRGDLVDVTIAVENRLIQAHKIVLAICSPYFQEMFQQNPCKHPIIILKDVSYSVMSELLQFMYQGEVNVKHTELPTFMKIAETLQIKGLTTPPSQKQPNSPMHHQLSHHRRPPQSTSPMHMQQQIPNSQQHSSLKNSSDSNVSSPQQPPYPNTQGSGKLETPSSSQGGQKRGATDYVTTDSYNSASAYAKAKIPKRSVGSEVTENSNGPNEINNDSMDNMTDEVFMPPIPQISMSEGSRFDLNNVKRENPENAVSPAPRQSTNYNYDYNNVSGASSSSGYTPSSKDYANDMHDYGNKGHHMEIPPGINNITMLSSTSLLHGNCIFNRNNTVATQQGMKTYWLCKSYRITMCRARCITHQGRVISATGVHNHAPHMKNGPNSDSNDPNQPPPQPIVITSSVAASGHGSVNSSIASSQSLRVVSTSQQQQQQLLQAPPPLPPNQSPPLLPHHMSTLQQLTGQSSSHHLPISAVQHMGPGGAQHMHHLVTGPTGQPMSSHGMLNSNNLMHQHVATSIHGLTNIGPILNPLQQHHVLSNIHPPPSLQITPVINSHMTQSPANHNGVRPLLPPPSQTHQNIVQSMHESPSPNHSLNNMQQQTMTTATASSVQQSQNNQQNIHQQSQSEDSNQQTLNEGHPQEQSESMMQMEMASQQQQQMTNQTYKMEHGI